MITKDKLYHLIAGFGIGLVLGFWQPVVALFAAWLAGMGKEVYDLYIKKTYADPVDAIATLIGGIFGTAIAILVVNTF